MGKNRIGIIATDLRQIYMEKILKEKGYAIVLWDQQSVITDMPLDFWECSDYILPVPMSRLKNVEMVTEQLIRHKNKKTRVFGGVFSPDMKRDLEQAKIQVIDVLKDQQVARRNAIATAEGTLAELAKLMPVNIEDSGIMILGFGKCGKIIAEKLYCLGAKVSVVARSKEALELARLFDYAPYVLEIGVKEGKIPYGKMDAVINTIPAAVFGAYEINQLKKDAVVIDIASAPGGCDFAFLKEKKIPYCHALGLPGIYSPKSSAQILLDAMPF